MRRRGNKFNARKVDLDGYKFDSAKEARRYQELLLLKMAGEVLSFGVHPSYQLIVNGRDIGRMTLDFEVVWASGERTWEDCKGGRATKTEAYSLRKRVWEALCAPAYISEI